MNTLSSNWNQRAHSAVILLGGLLFGFGLGLSRMVRPEEVLAFLQLENMGLMLVMGGAALVSGVTFWTMSRTGKKAPLSGKTYGRRHREFDSNVVTGGIVFGIGWGLSGLCPGAAYASVGVGNWPALIGIAGMFLGAYIHGLWRTQNVAASEPLTVAR